MSEIIQIWTSSPMQIGIAVTLLIGMLALFISEKYPPEVVALMTAIAFMVTGILSIEDAISNFSNSAPWTIAAMYVLSGAMIRTGVLNKITGFFSLYLHSHPRQTLAVGAIFIVTLSAFMNNTPVVVLLMPMVMQLAKELDHPASRYLIPLSYLAVIGGMVTLIGTSTNLLVDGVVRDSGMEPFHLFEISPLGIVMALAGIAYIAIFRRFLLPDRTSMADMLVNRKKMSFFTEVAVPNGSPVIGRNVNDVEIFRRDGMRIVDVLRGDESLRRNLAVVVLEEGDRVVLRTGVNELLGLKESRAIAMVDKLSERKTTTVEALISPGCQLVGRSLGALRLRRRYGVYPLAVHRRSQNLGRQLDDIVIRVGDTILLEGTPEDIHRLAQEANLLDLSEPTERSFRRGKAHWVVIAWLLVIACAAFEFVPLLMAASIAVGFVLLIRAIDIDEALSQVDGSLLLLIFCMLAVGEGIENSGAISAFANFFAPMLSALPPVVTLAALYLLTNLLTEILSNNAVAVLMTPIAIGLAEALGIDARPLVVAVMFAASLAFATPVGYQTNTMVYGPGGYKFSDFVRFGSPLNILFWILSSFLIPVFFPF